VPQTKYHLLSSQLINSQISTQDLVAQLLANRHISSDQVGQFLHPPTPQTIPHALKLKKAATLIKTLVKQGKNILIYGDYDVDGITATALLWQALSQLKANVTPYIPDRHLDGYGFKAKSFIRLQKEKGIIFNLLITADNGIVAQTEFQKLNQKLQIIVVDHHLPSAEPLSVAAKVHSTKLSAAGLAWFLADNLTHNADLGLAALGTVADSMPLVGSNRSLVVHGLNSLRVNPNPGIKKLIETCRIKQDSLSTYDLGFIIGPRINAVGRLSNPMDALRLLCAPNSQTAAKYVDTLNTFNQDRQQLQTQMLEQAESSYDQQPGKDCLIFVSSPEFHQGIIGLIAGRLTEKYYLPSVVISQVDGIAKGSCRSIPEVNIIDTLRRFDDLFEDLGGHAAAAGFSIKPQNIPKLQKKLTKYLNQQLQKVNLTPHLEIDAPMALSAVTVKNFRAIQTLEPFGLGNPKPLFLFSSVSVLSKRLVGTTGDHLKLKLDDPSTPNWENVGTDAIAFRQGSIESQIKPGQLVDVVASLDVNYWNGQNYPQLIVKDIVLR
jgi:single-stranded-DNA-specific exonuclease